MSSYKSEEVALANKTSRSKGNVGHLAIVPRYIYATFDSSVSILDFGAGKDAVHAKSLREEGLDVVAHEFGGNQNENHDSLALSQTYDVVYLSNVLNVQQSGTMLSATIYEIESVMHSDTKVIANYPATPRHLGWSVPAMERFLGQSFELRRLDIGSNIIWEMTEKETK